MQPVKTNHTPSHDARRAAPRRFRAGPAYRCGPAAGSYGFAILAMPSPRQLQALPQRVGLLLGQPPPHERMGGGGFRFHVIVTPHQSAVLEECQLPRCSELLVEERNRLMSPSS